MHSLKMQFHIQWNCSDSHSDEQFKPEHIDLYNFYKQDINQSDVTKNDVRDKISESSFEWSVNENLFSALIHCNDSKFALEKPAVHVT